MVNINLFNIHTGNIMGTYIIKSIANNAITITELNSNEPIVLWIQKNIGQDTVSLYDEKESIWVFESSPIKQSDFKIGQQLILSNIIVKPQEG